MGQKFAAYNQTGAITGFYDSVDSPAPSGVTSLAITDAQWQQCLAQPGYTVVNGALVPPAAPTSAQLLAAAQASQVALLTQACQAAIEGGFTSSALGSAYTYPSGTTDQRNLSDAMNASLVPGLPSNWSTPLWCASNGTWSFEPHTAAQVQQVHTDWVTFRVGQQGTLIVLKQQIATATTVAAVQAVYW